MKKLMILAAAVAAMAACTKSEVVYDDNDTEIGLAPVSYMSTKAAQYGPVSGNDYPTAEHFGVFASHTTASAGNENFTDGTGTLSDYLKNVEFKKDDTESVWKGVAKYYWPKTGSLYFAGYSPFEITSENEDYKFDRTSYKLTITDFYQGTYAYTDGTTPNDYYEMVDLMWFDATATSSNTGAPVVTFKHALSYLTFDIKTEDDYVGLFEIKSVTLKNVVRKGTFVSRDENSSYTPTWNLSDDFADKISEMSLYGNTVSVTVDGLKIEDILLIPQPTTELEIVYTQKASTGQPAIEQVYKTKLTGGESDNSPEENWLINKHYTYTITFKADEIKLTPKVDNWEPVKQNIDIK